MIVQSACPFPSRAIVIESLVLLLLIIMVELYIVVPIVMIVSIISGIWDIVDCFCIVLTGFTLLFLHSIVLLFSINWFSSEYYYWNEWIGIDVLSIVMLLLSSYIGMIILLSMYKSIFNNIRVSLVLIVGVFMFIYGAFVVIDMLMFYVCFEFMLIPVFVYIAMYGSSKRKVQAAYELFVYTMFGSILFLFSLVLIWMEYGTSNMLFLSGYPMSNGRQFLVMLCMLIGFGVKMPVFPFHLWLPKAHVESPTSASVLLAAILLKFGTYALIRFSLVLSYDVVMWFKPVVLSCGLLGVIYGSISALSQIDIKRVIAYSSVSHMNLSLVGIFSYNVEGLIGTIVFVITHALVASGLFLLIGVLYERYHSRLVDYYGGLSSVMPIWSILWLVLSLSNLSFPFTGSFIAELMLSIGCLSSDGYIVLLFCVGIVTTPLYCIWFYHKMCCNTVRFDSLYNDMTVKEYSIVVSIMVPVIVIGVCPYIITDITMMCMLSLV